MHLSIHQIVHPFHNLSIYSFNTGINKKALPDSPELAECVHKTLWLIKRIFSSKQSSSDQFKDIMTICRETFTSCFHAFYPSALLKWFALCNLLQQIDPVSWRGRKT